MFTGTHAIPCKDLVREYEKKKSLRSARKIIFLGVDGYDVYNISVAFSCAGKEYIAGRVEKRDTEFSMVRFFEKTGDNEYTAVFPEMMFTNFQDPFVTFIDGNLVLGGVQIIADPLVPDRIVSWHTCFYKGADIPSLRLFAIGPSHMKDIRLCGLPGGKVACFTRPQGIAGGKGKIGYIEFDNLDAVNGESMLQAKIYDTHFLPEEWGGTNDIHLLSNGLLGVMGHIARHDEEGLHYQSMCFLFDPASRTHSPVKIVACRKDMSSGPSKRPDLKDVLFTGGIVRNKDGTATLYTGVSDCEAYCAVIDDPFLPFEQA